MELDVKLLQNKICHTVEEIRVRTLNSILYKVQQNLIEPAHLTGEQQLYKALLKSLSYKGNGHGQALTLLDLLSSDNVGTSTLVSAGGLAALNDYRTTGVYNPLADTVIDKILSFEVEENEDSTSAGDISEHSINSTQKTGHVTSESLLSNTIDKSNNCTIRNNHIFPHIVIDCNDVQILENIEERLCDDELCEESCQFVTTVLLQDFLPEVFLQRDGIVCNIFKMLRESNTVCPNSSREKLAIQCFTSLIIKLEVRVKLLEKSWVTNPQWYMDTEQVEKRVDDTHDLALHPGLSLPRFMFGVLKSVLPVYKRCEDEHTAQLLSAHLLSLSSLLETVNNAPFNFTIDTNQLHTVFGLLSESMISLHRRWMKTSLISSLAPLLLSTLLDFSISFFEHFVPAAAFKDYLSTSLVDTFTDLYTNQIFYISYRWVHTRLEQILDVLNVDIVEQYTRLRLMLDAIEIATHYTPDITPLQLQQLYDGLEVLVHYKNTLLIEQVVKCFVEHLTIDMETCSNSLIWLMSNKQVQVHVYAVLCTLTASSYIPLPRDVLWELIVHGLNSAPDTQMSASSTIRHLLTKVEQEPPTVQLKFYRSLQPSLYFLTVALTHCIELRESVVKYLQDNEHYMTELEVIRTWLPFMLSREESLRSQVAVPHVAKWAITQGVGLQLCGSSLIVSESNKIVLTYTLNSGMLDVESIEKLKLIAFNESLSEELRVSAFMQLAVLLSDGSLQDIPLHRSLVPLLCNIDIKSPLVLPVVKALRHILHHNKQVRKDMSVNTELYASLLRLIGNTPDLDSGYEVETEVRAEVTTLLVLMTVHDFSHSTCWTDSSYYTLYDIVLPDTVPLSFHLPAHITTLCPARPLPPPTLPNIWLPWLQLHYFIMCSGSVRNFLHSEGLGDEPMVEAAKDTLRKVYLYHQTAQLSNNLLILVSNMASKDTKLSELVQQEITSRLSDSHPSCDKLEMLRCYQTPLSPTVISYFISKLEEDESENRGVCSKILQMFNSHSLSHDSHMTTRLFCTVFRLFVKLQQYTDALSISQLAANTLAITSNVLKITEKEKHHICSTLVKHIDNLAHGRGSKTSFMGAYILRKLFCTLSNVCKDIPSKINIRWIIPWLTDKDVVIRCAAFSLHFEAPESPLTTESAIILAIAAFADHSEVYTVRQQALYFVNRILNQLKSVNTETTEQVYALCILALKRLAFYNNCTSFVAELEHLVNFRSDVPTIPQNPMISTYFEDISDTDTKWTTGLLGLFYILDGILDLNLTLSKFQVVMLKDNSDLLDPLYSVFTADTLKSIVVFDTSIAHSSNSAALEVYTLCYCKVLQLTNTAMFPCSNTVAQNTLLQSLLHILAWECQLPSVLHLKHFSLYFLNTLTATEVLDEYWAKLVPNLLQLLTHPTLQSQTLSVFNNQLKKRGNTNFTKSLASDSDTINKVCSVFFDIFSKIKILNMTKSDELVLSVMGTMCFKNEQLQSNFLELGVVEITIEYIMLVEKRLRALVLAGEVDKENVPENRRRMGEGGEDLLKNLNCLFYSVTGFVCGKEAGAKRLVDLDYLGIVQRLWVYYSHNIVLLNTVIKSLTIFVQTSPNITKLFPSINKQLLIQIIDLAEKSVLYSKHSVRPLQNVLFDFLSELALHNQCITAIWKSGFISNFPRYEKQKVPVEKVRPWLKFFIHASYTTFGQNNVLSVPNLLSIIFECGQAVRMSALFLIRSLVFSSKCHPKLIDHQYAIQYVLNSVVIEKPKQTLLALQIMLYFIKFSAKAKSVLRVKGAGQVLGKLELKLQETVTTDLGDTLSTLVKVYSL